MSEPRPGAGAEPERTWAANTLLVRPREAPRFQRAAWDTPGARDFDRWRVAPQADPAPALPAPLPQDEPADAVAEAVQADEPVAAAPAEPGISAQALREAQERAHARGLEEGRARAREEFEAARATEMEALSQLAGELQSLREDPDRFFEPLRRLALHIAEQLVRGELQASSHAISQIVRQCLAALDEPSATVVASLHPEDAAALEAEAPAFLQGVRLQPDPALRRGSVRLRMDDTVLEDLIDHRLDAIVQPLLARPGARPGQSVLLRDTLPAEPLEDRPLRRARGGGEIIDAAAIPVPDAVPDPADPQEPPG